MAAFAISTPAWSLGLGEIELQSALNEEFVASIELLDAQGLQPDELLVSLASTEDFNRVGVERFFFLTDLKFQVTAASNGTAQVLITSSRPITEPYLNFLVQVLWPSGRLLKEYTVLLDPPTFSAAAAPAVRAPAQDRAAANSGQVQRSVGGNRPADRVQVAPTAATGAPDGTASALDEDVVGNEFRMTDRDDTLWSIASRSRPSAAVSVQQNMLAIQQLNPDAFINGNINLLKAGYSLRLPDERQALALSDGEALAEVSRQNAQWQAINRGEQIASRDDAQAPSPTTRIADTAGSTSRSPVDASSRTAAATAPRQTDGELKIIADDGDSAVGVADAAGTGQSAAVLEENDRLAREVEQLTYQLDREKDLASDQIAVKERQLEVKDQQIAELQAQLAAAQQQQPSAAQSQNQSAAPEPDQAWWQSPVVLYGGAGALVLLLVGGMMLARRRRDEDAFYADSDELAESRHEPALAQATAQVAEAELDDYEEAEPVAREQQTGEHEVPDSETSDVIGEADIYIAYGRYPQAIGLLLGVLEEDAGRNDVRLKLLEVYAETNDREAFDEHMAALIEHCDEEDALLTARDLEARFGEGAITLDEMVQESTETAAAAVSTGSGDDALDFDSGLDSDVEEAEQVESRDRPIDFTLEIDDGTADDVVESSRKSGAGDELGGDLGIDFDPDRDTDTLTMDGDAAEATSDLDELSLDDGSEFEFDDEGDSANTKLDLARAYIDMGDADGARDILREVMDEGNSEQQQRAQSMLEAL